IPYIILAVKQGFETTTHTLPRELSKVTIPLIQGTAVHHQSLLVWYIRDLLDIGFEVLLLVSIAFEILMSFALGFSATGIFIVISLLNFILWTHHVHIKQREAAAT